MSLRGKMHGEKKQTTKNNIDEIWTLDSRSEIQS